MDFTVGIVSQNLVTQLNFFEFRYSRNFMFFEASSVVTDTWHIIEWPTLNHVSKGEENSKQRGKSKGWPCVKPLEVGNPNIWIRGKGERIKANGGVTCGKERTSHLSMLEEIWWREGKLEGKKERKRRKEMRRKDE